MTSGEVFNSGRGRVYVTPTVEDGRKICFIFSVTEGSLSIEENDTPLD